MRVCRGVLSSLTHKVILNLIKSVFCTCTDLRLFFLFFNFGYSCLYAPSLSNSLHDIHVLPCYMSSYDYPPSQIESGTYFHLRAYFSHEVYFQDINHSI